MEWVRRRLRALPPIARRDRQIAELKANNLRDFKQLSAARAKNAALKARARERSVKVPSFRRNVYAERRMAALMRDLNRTDRGTSVTNKLRSYSFARSWGVDVPEIHGIWDRIEDIVWDDLPDTIVIKSRMGSYARGVLPLKRVAGGWLVITGDGGILTPTDIVARYRARRDDGTAAGPYIVEEFLGDVERDLMPIDVKFYAFYGEVAQLYLRSVAAHLEPNDGTYRVLDRDGQDLGPIYIADHHDETIPIPKNLPDLVRVAELLSAAVPRAFIRIDLYEVDGRVVFGELTPRPGGRLTFPAEADARLGRFWEDAQVRLLNDAIDGVGYALRFGPEPRELLVGGKPYLPPLPT
ncbi:MAG: hypothetical protein QOJ72_599 [Nocardioidaceae bacterium]|nr:hypothetical protein [Nocardioidaceae bacterium]